jgi:hypothetical protein
MKGKVFHQPYGIELLELVLTPIADHPESPDAIKFLTHFEADDEEYVWACQSKNTFAEVTVMRYWDMRTEKPLTFKFCTETNLN